MTDADFTLMFNILKQVQADVSDIKHRLTGVEVQLTAMGQQLAGLTTAVYGQKGDVDDLRRRVERIERRLEITDAAH